MLKWHLVAFQNAFVFQVIQQSDKLTKWLKRQGGSFVASNGWTISISKN